MDNLKFIPICSANEAQEKDCNYVECRLYYPIKGFAGGIEWMADCCWVPELVRLGITDYDKIDEYIRAHPRVDRRK